MIRYRFDHDRPQKALHQCESAKNSSLKNMSLHIDGNIMPVVTQFSDLGIFMSNNLLPTSHITSIVAKAHQRAKTLDFDTARTIATSLVHSKLDYCNSLYYNLPQSQLKRLQSIQNSGSLRHFQLSLSTHNTWTKISSMA
jgi:hypothetical protein